MYLPFSVFSIQRSATSFVAAPDSPLDGARATGGLFTAGVAGIISRKKAKVNSILNSEENNLTVSGRSHRMSFIFSNGKSDDREWDGE